MKKQKNRQMLCKSLAKDGTFFLFAIDNQTIVGVTTHHIPMIDLGKAKSYRCFKTLNSIFSQGARPNILFT